MIIGLGYTVCYPMNMGFCCCRSNIKNRGVGLDVYLLAGAGLAILGLEIFDLLN